MELISVIGYLCFLRMVFHPLDGRIPWLILSCLCCWLPHSTYLSRLCSHHRSVTFQVSLAWSDSNITSCTLFFFTWFYEQCIFLFAVYRFQSFVKHRLSFLVVLVIGHFDVHGQLFQSTASYYPLLMLLPVSSIL